MSNSNIITIQERVEALRTADPVRSDFVYLNPTAVERQRSRDRFVFALQRGQPLEAQGQSARGRSFKLVAGLTLQRTGREDRKTSTSSTSGSLWTLVQSSPSISHAPAIADVQPRPPKESIFDPQFGFNCAISALDSAFNGFLGDGYLDIHPRVGLDISFAQAAGSPASSDIELSTVLPLTSKGGSRGRLSHRISLLQGTSEPIAHDTGIKIPALASRFGGTTLSLLHSQGSSPLVMLEIGKTISHGAQVDHNCSRVMTPTTTTYKQSSELSDSDTWHAGDAPSLGGKGRRPALRVGMVAPRQDTPWHRRLSLNWQHPWRHGGRSSVMFDGVGQRAQVRAEVFTKLNVGLAAGAALEGISLRKWRCTMVRMSWKPRLGSARHAFHIESKFDVGGMATHAVCVRRRVARGAGGPADKVGFELEVKARYAPLQRRGSVEFDLLL